MACCSLWLQVVVVVVVVAYAAAVFSLQAADKILVDTEGWHGRVIGRRTGSPGAPLPHSRLPHMGNWLLLLPRLLLLLLLFACCPLMSACLYLSFLSFSVPLRCSSHPRWNWKFVGLKFEMVQLNILCTRHDILKKPWRRRKGNKGLGLELDSEDDDVKRKYFFALSHPHPN